MGLKNNISNLIFTKEFHAISLNYLLIISIISFFEIFLILTFLPILFETNDDTAMNAIASGAITGSPSEYLIFSNIIIGKILKALFTYLPATNWYTWYMLLSAFAGYVSIQYSINRINGKLWLKILRHLLIFGLLIMGILSLQFTKIAAITLLGGFLLIFTSKSKETKQMILGIFLIVLGSLIRFEVFMMYLILSIPFLTFYLLKKEYYKLLVILVASVFVLGTHRIDNYAYNNNPEFKTYKEYNKLRSQITYSDNPSISYQRKHAVAKEIGWSYNDFLLATNFNLDTGHPKFTKEKLLKLADEPRSVMEKTFSNDFIVQLKQSSLALLNYLNSIYFYIFYIFFFLYLIEKRWKQLMAVLLYFLYILCITFFIHYYMDGRLKVRILFGMVLPLFVMIICQMNFKVIFNSGFINSKIVKTALLIIAVWAVCIPIVDTSKKRAWIYETIETNKKMADLIAAQQDDFYVNWVILPEYNIFDLPFQQKNGYVLGWFAGIPFNKDKIERYTGNRELGVYTIYNKKIVWYYRNDFFYKNYAPMVKNFYLSNYKDCTFKREIAKLDENRLLIKETYFITKP